MIRVKKRISLAVVPILLVACLLGCSQNTAQPYDPEDPTTYTGPGANPDTVGIVGHQENGIYSIYYAPLLQLDTDAPGITAGRKVTMDFSLFEEGESRLSSTDITEVIKSDSVAVTDSYVLKGEPNTSITVEYSYISEPAVLSYLGIDVSVNGEKVGTKDIGSTPFLGVGRHNELAMFFGTAEYERTAWRAYDDREEERKARIYTVSIPLTFDGSGTAEMTVSMLWLPSWGYVFVPRSDEETAKQLSGNERFAGVCGFEAAVGFGSALNVTSLTAEIVN